MTATPLLFSARRLRRVMRHRWWWKRTYYWPTIRAWHRVRFGVSVPPSMLAKLGRGRYVDVTRRGPYIDITAHSLPYGEPGMIRLIPYAPNHGVMVEFWQDGKVRWRTHADYEFFRDIATAQSEVSYRKIRAQIAEMEAAPDA